ncbi:MAG: hypothetical protein VX453_04830 [Acidobacteriota bacterium]|nr:hypothetical protein [Acidobacteriota bacterium]
MVVDALGSEEIVRQVRGAIAGVTDQPVRFLVSSTFRGRFTGGNVVSRAGRSSPAVAALIGLPDRGRIDLFSDIAVI